MYDAPMMLSEEQERKYLLDKKPLKFRQEFDHWRQVAWRLSTRQVIIVTQENGGKVLVRSERPLNLDDLCEKQIARRNFIGVVTIGYKGLVVTREGVYGEMPDFLAIPDYLS
ncbi:MAG: hypothetical protein Q8L10_03050 [Candidatus Moranbacteria bacterium]|nr:hypothetical protein [Candidatus Moranbacteria bacterium]